MISRRTALAWLLASSAAPALAEAPRRSLRPVLRPERLGGVGAGSRSLAPLSEVVATSGLSGAHSIVLADAGSGDVLEALDAGRALPPASVTKAVTALYALQHLGRTHRFVTRVVATGPIEAGVLKGDLVLVGGGDPHLDTDGLDRLAAAVAARGVRQITGAFRVHGGALPYQPSIDPGQPDHVGYNPAISGINLNFNRVFFEWKRAGNAYRTTVDARSERLRPRVRGVEVDIVERKAPLFTYREGSPERWTVMRGALGRGGGRWLPVRRLDAYAGEVFRALAAARGVRLPPARTAGRVPEGGVIAEERSAPLSEIVRLMLKYSTNLTAEVVGLAATLARGAQVRDLEGSAREMTGWARSAYGLSGARFEDHSGLGDGSRVSAGEMAALLAKSGWHGPLRPLLKEIPLVNARGKKAPIEGVAVYAKTGTLNFASALAGYITCPNGRRLAFAIFSADMPRRARLSRSERERPEGGRQWARRARAMQQELLRRWALAHGRAG